LCCVTSRVLYRWTPTCYTERHPLNLIYVCIVSFSLLAVSLMSKVTAQPDDTFDVDSFRLPSCVVGPVSPSGPVRFRRGQRFLRGPIPWDWLSVAAPLPGKALQVGLAAWHLAGLKRDMTVELSRRPLESLGVTRQAAYRGLKALENAGLIKAARRSGRKTRVTILLIST
jgi:hypothetical protein